MQLSSNIYERGARISEDPLCILEKSIGYLVLLKCTISLKRGSISSFNGAVLKRASSTVG